MKWLFSKFKLTKNYFDITSSSSQNSLSVSLVESVISNEIVILIQQLKMCLINSVHTRWMGGILLAFINKALIRWLNDWTTFLRVDSLEFRFIWNNSIFNRLMTTFLRQNVSWWRKWKHCVSNEVIHMIFDAFLLFLLNYLIKKSQKIQNLTHISRINVDYFLNADEGSGS